MIVDSTALLASTMAAAPEPHRWDFRITNPRLAGRGVRRPNRG